MTGVEWLWIKHQKQSINISGIDGIPDIPDIDGIFDNEFFFDLSFYYGDNLCIIVC